MHPGDRRGGPPRYPRRRPGGGRPGSGPRQRGRPGSYTQGGYRRGPRVYAPARIDGSTVTLEGSLERFVFRNEENAWCVVRLALPGQKDPATVTGNLLGAQVGETLRVRGSWVHDVKFGPQFKVQSYVTVEPSTLVGLKKYLGSGMVEGIGPVMAERLVEHFKLETLDVIEEHPDRLAEVDGIGPKRARSIQSAWKEQKSIKDVMVFLQGHGVTTTLAVKIYKAYGEKAIALVRENPYRLATDLFRVGFRTADTIAQGMGVEPDSPERMRAGLLHTLREAGGKGHVFVPETGLLAEASKLLGIEGESLSSALEDVVGSGEVIAESPPGADSRAIFLPKLHESETLVARKLAALAATPPPSLAVDIPRAVEWFERRTGLSLSKEQRKALARAVDSGVLVVTGGPGTGKTTLLRAILDVLRAKKRRILLAAPTGRAARRLTEATGRSAQTIHRLLRFNPREQAFDHDEARPLEADMVVIDEASMLDITLMADLLRAIPVRAQLLLVGDIDQLPSVGPGNVLGDTIASGIAEVVRLTEIFRQARRSRIVLGAHRVNEGRLPLTREDESDPRSDLLFVQEDTPLGALRVIERLVSRELPGTRGLDPVDDIQVLTPMHKGDLGAANLNTRLQALLNPRGPAITRGHHSFRRGDKVMQLRNNYDLGVSNGDIGRIQAVDEETRSLHVAFEGRTVCYEAGHLDELELSYACSIHKSQGSEFPAVVIPIHTQHFIMLQRNLLYTALTRGKRLVVLVGSRRALGIAVRSAEMSRRWTRLADRLAERLAATEA